MTWQENGVSQEPSEIKARATDGSDPVGTGSAAHSSGEWDSGPPAHGGGWHTGTRGICCLSVPHEQHALSDKEGGRG